MVLRIKNIYIYISSRGALVSIQKTLIPGARSISAWIGLFTPPPLPAALPPLATTVEPRNLFVTTSKFPSLLSAYTVCLQ